MTQFRSRFQSRPTQSFGREDEVKLHMPSFDSYAREAAHSPYDRHHTETEKIKSLSFWDNGDQEEKEEDEWAERQSPTPFILVMVIIVVASALLWFLYQWASGENSNTPLIIPADTTPFKVRPENPGGMMIPHQDKLIYGRLSQDTRRPIERLLPPSEQPIAAPHMAPLSPQHPHLQEQGYAVQQQGYVPQQGPQPQFQGPQPQFQGSQPQFQEPPSHGLQPPADPQFQPQPQQLRQYQPFQSQGPYPQQHLSPGQLYVASPQQQAPYGSAAPIQAPLMPPTPQIPLQAASNPAPPKYLSAVEGIKPALESEEVDDASPFEGQNELDQLIAKEAETPLKKSRKIKEEQAIKLMPVDPKKYKVQIASLPSRSMAEQEAKRLQAHHKVIFQNKPWNIQKVNLGPNRGVTHRLIMGSFSNHDVASRFCKKLRAEKIGCMVVSPVG